jgi:hypothetical protein
LYYLSCHCIACPSIVLRVLPLYCLSFHCITCPSIVLSVLPLYCLSFHCIASPSTGVPPLIVPLVSSNCSYYFFQYVCGYYRVLYQVKVIKYETYYHV